MAKDGQTTIPEAERTDADAEAKKAQQEYAKRVKNHEQMIKDLKGSVVILTKKIEDATNLSGSYMKLTDELKSLQINSTLDRVEFEKKAKDTEKTQAAYIGSLKQAKKLVEQKVDYLKKNPPEPPAPV